MLNLTIGEPSITEDEVTREPITEDPVTYIGLNEDFDYNPQYIELNESKLTSKSYILKNLTTGQTLYSKDMDRELPVASLTKMMTGYIFVSENNDLSQHVDMDPNLVRVLNEEGASMAGFLPGDSIKLEDTLYGIILSSGADASILFANNLSDDEAHFANTMNEYASELNMTHTNFKNSTGLDMEGHYSTVHDLSKLLTTAMNDEDFRDVFTTFTYTGEPTKLNELGYTYNSTINNYDKSINGGRIIGGKTGYTEDAGLCLASVAKIGSDEYMFISVGADPESTNWRGHIEDARLVYNQINEELE